MPKIIDKHTPSEADETPPVRFPSKWRYLRHRPESAAPGTPRPDGKPWLTKEQILDKLDQTLSLRDKARIQRTSEEDANKCMLCWLGRKISEEIEVEERRNIASEHCPPDYQWFIYRNPNFPPGTGILRCGIRKCDESSLQKGENPNSWKETASCQSDANHGTLFLDGGPYCEDGAYDYVKRHRDKFWRRWIKEIDAKTECDLNGLELDRKFGKPDRVKDAPRSYRIWFQHGDGTREQVPGVYFPDLDVWKKKRIGEWIVIGKRIDFWLILEGAGYIAKDPPRETRFRTLSEQIGKYADDNGPEPSDDIDLATAIPAEEQAIMDQAQAAYDQEAGRVIRQVVDRFIKARFPSSNWTRDENRKDQ